MTHIGEQKRYSTIYSTVCQESSVDSRPFRTEFGQNVLRTKCKKPKFFGKRFSFEKAHNGCFYK